VRDNAWTRVSIRRTALGAMLLTALALVAAGSAGAATITSWFGGKSSVPQIVTADGNCPGTIITINGSGFVNDGGLSVSIGGVPANQIIVGQDTVIWARVASTATTGPVIVTTSKGSVTAPGGNAIVYPCQSTGTAGEKPSVASLKPTSAKAGAKLTLSGAGFVGTKSVTVGGEKANYAIPSDNLMYIRLPADLKSGALDIVITNNLGTTKSSVTIK
jgi:IPT/TIG domain